MSRMRIHAIVITAVAAMSIGLSAQNPAPVRIHAAKVVDGAGRVLNNATIVVQGSKIATIDTGGSPGSPYELGPLTVMPGMIDVHSHLGWHFGPDGRYQPRGTSPAQEILYSAENAYVTLMAGFTT